MNDTNTTNTASLTHNRSNPRTDAALNSTLPDLPPMYRPIEHFAKAMGISRSLLAEMIADGRFAPAKHFFGRSVRYYVPEFLAWCEAGRPKRDDWEGMRPAKFLAYGVGLGA